MSSNDTSPHPAYFQIRVGGQLDETWSAWFDDMCIVAGVEEDRPVTHIQGYVTDQAALFSLLRRVQDLGLPLLAVNRLNHSPE